MFAVEVYAAVRRFVFIEGNSRREAARVFRLSRDTIGKMCRFSVPPGYVRSKPPEKPKLGALIPVIDAILEADKTAPPKQRHTAKRIFERLRDEHGFSGGYTVVKDHARLARTRNRETFGKGTARRSLITRRIQLERGATRHGSRVRAAAGLR